MNKVLSFIITAKNRTQSGLSAAMTGMKSFAKVVFTNLMNIQAGFGMLKSAIQSVGALMSKAIEAEKMTYQFKTLVGSMDEARAHMKMLKELGDTPPFSLEEFAKASRAMMVMSDGILGFRDSLELVGDAAAATGQPIETLAHEVGRAYAIIRDGQPLTRATMSLRNMGILTPEVAAKLDDLQKSGASATEIWSEFTASLERYKGAMKDSEETMAGTVGALSAQMDDAKRAFGEGMLTPLNEGTQSLQELIKTLNEDDSFKRWGQAAGAALGVVLKGLNEVTGYFTDETYGMSEEQKMLYAIGKDAEWRKEHPEEAAELDRKAAEDAAWGDWEEYREEGQHDWQTRRRRHNSKTDAWEYQLIEDVDARDKWQAEQKRLERAAKLKEELEKKEQERRAAAAQRAAEEQAKFDAQNAEDYEQALIAAESAAVDAELNGQSEVAQKRAQLAAEYADALADVSTKEEKAELDAATALAKSRLDLEQKIEDARNRALEEQAEYEKEMQEARLAELEAERKKRIENVRDELAASQEAEREASSRLSAADSAVAQAWGWYRNKDSMQSAIDDYNAQKEAEKQWAKDFERLKSKNRDWRDVEFGKLSADDEAVRQVALAKEEQQAARKALSEISENTAYLKDIADALSAEGEG